MNFKQLWQKHLNWVFIVWSIYAIMAHPGWLAFALGMVVWVGVIYFTAPGVFWTYVYLLPSNSNYDTEKTIAKLQRAIDHKPLISLPYASLGILYARNGRWAEAIPHLEAAIPLGTKKERIEIKTILAVAYRETGDYQGAFRILDELVAQGIKNFKIHYNYAMCYLRQQRYNEALEAIEKARALKLDSAEPVLLLAKIYFTMGRFTDARDNYEWAIAHTNWPVESYYWLGRAQLELGEAVKAVEHLEKAVERIVDDPALSDVSADEARQWLERARAATGPEQNNQDETKRPD